VARLEVAVDGAEGVDGGEGLGHLHAQPADGVERHRMRQLEGLRAADELLDEERLAVLGLAHLAHGGEARMAHRRQRLGLAHEAARRQVVQQVLPLDDLEGPAPLALQVHRLEDLAEVPFAQPAPELVAADDRDVVADRGAGRGLRLRGRLREEGRSARGRQLPPAEGARRPFPGLGRLPDRRLELEERLRVERTEDEFVGICSTAVRTDFHRQTFPR
jgi:hypothetical protein